MKNILKTLTIVALLTFSSCSEDEMATTNENDQIVEELEQTGLEANSVSNNVLIAGGTKNEGAPPTPNEGITLDVSSSSQTAFLNEGFDISISSNGNVTGAYLLFKSNDGVAADSYYDVDLSLNSSNKVTSRNPKISKKLYRNTAKREETTLDVDFNSQLEPGTFCYEICVYDAQGNISAPQEVCVTVESWGGFSDLVATWNYVKQEITFGGETEVFELGDPDCDVWTIQCDGDQGDVEVASCFVDARGTIEFKANGTYVFEFQGDFDEVDYEATAAQCQMVSNESSYIIRDEGNWAYVLSEKRLTLVSYTYSEIYEDEEYTDSYEPGDGEVLFDGNAELNGNSFVLTQSFDYEGDGVADEMVKVYFEK